MSLIDLWLTSNYTTRNQKFSNVGKIVEKHDSIEASVSWCILVHVGERYSSRHRHMRIGTGWNGLGFVRCGARYVEKCREMDPYSRRGKCNVSRGQSINCTLWPSSNVVSSASENGYLFPTSTLLCQRKDISLIAGYARDCPLICTSESG